MSPDSLYEAVYQLPPPPPPKPPPENPPSPPEKNSPTPPDSDGSTNCQVLRDHMIHIVPHHIIMEIRITAAIDIPVWRRKF